MVLGLIISIGFIVSTYIEAKGIYVTVPVYKLIKESIDWFNLSVCVFGLVLQQLIS